MELGQGGLDECGGRADDGGDPHPEHRACAACGNRGHNAHHVAHAHAGGGGDDQGLEAGEGVLLLAVLLFNGQADHLREEADQDKTGADGKVDTGRDQDQNQQGNADGTAAGQSQGEQIAPQEAHDSGDQIQKQLGKIGND